MRLLVVALALGLGATNALAADQQILGSQLLVKNPGPTDKRSFVGKAKELASPNPLVGDPTVGGATLTVRADGDNPTSQTFLLPQGTSLSGKPFWSGTTATGFKYKDPKGEQGPVKSAQIKKSGSGTFLIKAKGTSKIHPISLLPPNLGNGGCILLELGGGDSYSVAFPNGLVTNKEGRLFKIKKPTIEGTCVIPGPTTSTTSTIAPTTTTESTTSTTESTTSSTESTTTSTESTTSSTESSTSSTESTTSSTESTSTSTSSSTSSTESTSTSTSSSTSSTESTSTSTSSSTSSTESTSTSTSSSTSSTESTSTSTSSSSSSSSSSTSSSSSSSSTSSSSSSSSSSTSSSTSTSTSSTTTSTLGGPALPPDVGGTGTITFGLTGASAGDSGGQTVTFTCVDTTWTKLYWGSSSGAAPGAGLDSTLHTLSFTSFSSSAMQWDGTTSWTNPDTGLTHTGVPVRMVATVTAGGLSFVSPPPGAPAIGATVKVVDPAGTCSSFAVKVEFFADIPTDGSGFIAINTVRSAGTTRSSFTGAFYFVP